MAVERPAESWPFAGQPQLADAALLDLQGNGAGWTGRNRQMNVFNC